MIKWLAFAFVWAMMFSCGVEETQETNSVDTLAVSDSLLPQKETLSNEFYGMSMQAPSDWQIVSSGPGNSYGVNILPDTANTTELLNVHAPYDLSYVSIWPTGYGTELPSGRSEPFSQHASTLDLTFAVDPRSSVFLMKDGTPWAYFLIPANKPANWDNYGFVFAQISVSDFKATCFDKKTGQPKPLSQCDPLEGDQFVREGFVRGDHTATIKNVLSSLQIQPAEKSGDADTSQAKNSLLSDTIRIDRPAANAKVSSPLMVSGSARGMWFFEAEFPVKLLDANGEQIAYGNAMAQGKWMTTDFVPFQVVLTFNRPKTAKGMLIFEKANPSGLAEHARQLQIPVTFR